MFFTERLKEYIESTNKEYVEEYNQLLDTYVPEFLRNVEKEELSKMILTEMENHNILGEYSLKYEILQLLEDKGINSLNDIKYSTSNDVMYYLLNTILGLNFNSAAKETMFIEAAQLYSTAFVRKILVNSVSTTEKLVMYLRAIVSEAETSDIYKYIENLNKLAVLYNEESIKNNLSKIHKKLS